MPAKIKICGLTTEQAAAALLGADYAGFVFFPPSPRALTPEQAAIIARALPGKIKRVALFVDPDDDALTRTAAVFPFDFVQLHGGESPARVAAIKKHSRRPVIKAIALDHPDDLARAQDFEGVADAFLFDAPQRESARPGGNARSFDWQLLARYQGKKPWFLSGGLTADNVTAARAITGAPGVDVSSGVEERPGIKSPKKITAFIAAAQAPYAPPS